jgi:hypothetical protein
LEVTGEEDDESSEENQPSTVTQTKYDLADVLILLANIYNSNIRIPLVLMADILNYAGTLPVLKASRSDGFRSGNNANVVYLELPLPRSLYIQPEYIRAKAISKDQGWSSYPNEQGMRTSHTWGELMVKPHISNRYPFFRNIHAGRSSEQFDLTISMSDESTPEEYVGLKDALRSTSTAPQPANDSAQPPTQAQEQAATDTSSAPATALCLVVRSKYPGWNIIMGKASLQIRYRLAGDWGEFERQCALRRGR